VVSKQTQPLDVERLSNAVSRSKKQNAGAAKIGGRMREILLLRNSPFSKVDEVEPQLKIVDYSSIVVSADRCVLEMTQVELTCHGSVL
jgi:hypothetical protein